MILYARPCETISPSLLWYKTKKNHLRFSVSRLRGDQFGEKYRYLDIYTNSPIHRVYYTVVSMSTHNVYIPICSWSLFTFLFPLSAGHGKTKNRSSSRTLIGMDELLGDDRSNRVRWHQEKRVRTIDSIYYTDWDKIYKYVVHTGSPTQAQLTLEH